jgi:hypothetical protein
VLLVGARQTKEEARWRAGRGGEGADRQRRQCSGSDLTCGGGREGPVWQPTGDVARKLGRGQGEADAGGWLVLPWLAPAIDRRELGSE